MSLEDFENKLSELYNSDNFKQKYYRKLNVGEYNTGQKLIALKIE